MKTEAIALIAGSQLGMSMCFNAFSPAWALLALPAHYVTLKLALQGRLAPQMPLAVFAMVYTAQEAAREKVEAGENRAVEHVPF